LAVKLPWDITGQLTIASLWGLNQVTASARVKAGKSLLPGITGNIIMVRGDLDYELLSIYLLYFTSLVHGPAIFTKCMA